MATDVREQLRQAVMDEAERSAETTRQELGDLVYEATGRYFPKAVKRRRRRNMAMGFLIGLGVGVLVRSIFD